MTTPSSELVKQVSDYITEIKDICSRTQAYDLEKRQKDIDMQFDAEKAWAAELYDVYSKARSDLAWKIKEMERVVEELRKELKL